MKPNSNASKNERLANTAGLPVEKCTNHVPVVIEQQAAYSVIDKQLYALQATKLFCANCGQTQGLDHTPTRHTKEDTV